MYVHLIFGLFFKKILLFVAIPFVPAADIINITKAGFLEKKRKKGKKI